MRQTPSGGMSLRYRAGLDAQAPAYREGMPAVRIDTSHPRSSDDVASVIEAVYLAQRQALKVPEGDRNIIYTEHLPERFARPPGRSAQYVRIEISLFPGRSIDAKRALYDSITDRLGALGIAPADVFIIVHEPPLENWGIAGRAASDIDLGFDLNV